MDKVRLQFQVRRGQPRGDKLILRNPAGTAPIKRFLLQESGQEALPQQVTIGYYRQLAADEPVGAWVFMPSTTPLARAALGIEVVRDRIGEDLQIRVDRQAQEAFDEPK